jgi:hypothetical protein
MYSRYIRIYREVNAGDARGEVQWLSFLAFQNNDLDGVSQGSPR